jgi:hypothetical protein
MNQATSRRLPGALLVLLVPLMMASTPPVLPEASRLVLGPLPPADHLVFVNPPAQFEVNVCVQLTVELHDAFEGPLNPLTSLLLELGSTGTAGGAFYASPGCNSPVSTVFILPTSSQVNVWYRASLAGRTVLTASDGPTGPLGDAVTGQLSVMSTTAISAFDVALVAPAPAVRVGIPVSFTVTALNGPVPSQDYAGTIHFLPENDPSVLVPADYAFVPFRDAGTKTFSVTFRAPGPHYLKVQDTVMTGVYGVITGIDVQPAPPAQLKFGTFPPQITAGTPVSFQVYALDGAGNPTSGALHFSTTVATYELPQDTPMGPLPQTFTARFLTASTLSQKLTVTETSTGITATQTFTVVPASFDSVIVTDNAQDPMPACAAVTVSLTAADMFGNPMPDAIVPDVKVCKETTLGSVEIVSPNLQAQTTTGACLSGTLNGTAQVLLKSMAGLDATFSVTTPQKATQVVVHWKDGIPSVVSSVPMFRESSETIPTLATYTGLLTMQFTLRDLCGKVLPVPTDRITFAADAPLRLTPVPGALNPGQGAVSVRLPECPVDPSKPLAIWPLINNEPLLRQNTTRLERQVVPQCVAPKVQVSVLTAADRLSIEPGAMGEFELEVSNHQDPPLKNGVLEFKPVGMKVLGAAIADTALTAQGEGFLLPELEKGSAVTVKVKAQALPQLDQPVSTQVWCKLQDGTAIAEPLSVEFKQARLGANVGCQAAGAAGQFLPWLAALLLASHPWGRLRRLRRGERTEH